MNEQTEWKTNEQWMNKYVKKKEISLAIESDKKENCLQLRERFELSSPGLQEQCSNHWANEAGTLVFKVDKTNKEGRKQKRTVNRDTFTKMIKMTDKCTDLWINK